MGTPRKTQEVVEQLAVQLSQSNTVTRIYAGEMWSAAMNLLQKLRDTMPREEFLELSDSILKEANVSYTLDGGLPRTATALAALARHVLIGMRGSYVLQADDSIYLHVPR